VGREATVNAYLGAIGEITACRLRIYARAMGCAMEPRERRAALEALNLLEQRIFEGRFMIHHAVSARTRAKNQILAIVDGMHGESVPKEDLMAWAAAWDEWASHLDPPRAESRPR
jgi:hypothetical protein